MTQNPYPDRAPDVPWPTSAERVPVPDTSMLPGSEQAAPAAASLLRDTLQGAHDTLDRLADRAEPAVRQLGASVSAAADALGAKTDKLRDTREAWVEDARATVRSNPLAAVVAALALGVVIARLTR